MASEEACVEDFRSLKRRKHPSPIDESGIMLNLSSPKPASFFAGDHADISIEKEVRRKEKAFSKYVYALML
jgi:hypothetical protein